MANQILNLSNSQYTDQDLKDILHSCFLNNKQYITIYAGNSRFTDYGIKILCNFITTQDNPINLALWKTGLTHTGVTFLIPVLSKLKKLFINENYIGNEGIEILGRGFSNNKSIGMLSIKNNLISGNGLAKFLFLIRENSTLQKMFLRQPGLNDNNINHLGFLIGTSLHNNRLEHVQLQRNQNYLSRITAESINSNKRLKHNHLISEIYVVLYKTYIVHAEPAMQLIKAMILPKHVTVDM